MPDTPPTQTFLQEFAVVTRKVRTLFDARVRKHEGMTQSRARLLLLLVRETRMTQGELATAMEVAGPTMARTIDSMEKAGLVAREVDADDRRVRWVTLTDTAKKQARKVLDLSLTLQADVLKGISSEDIATTRRVLAAMIENVGEAEG